MVYQGTFFADFYEYCISGAKLRMQSKNANANILYQKQNYLFYLSHT